MPSAVDVSEVTAVTVGSAVGAFSRARRRVLAVDEQAAVAARHRHDQLTKPAGSLGALEAVGARLAALSRSCPPPVPSPAAVAVFAGDHGVLARGVSPWPTEVTGQMVANFLAGGAAVNVLARHVGAAVVVVDVGVATDVPGGPNLVRARVRAGTADLSKGPAMSADEATAALDVGAAVADRLVAGGARCLLTGDMGIGNTTPSAVLIAAMTGSDAARVTGRGTGIDDERLATKTAVVAEALARVAGWDDPRAVLAEVGGLEIAALVGYIVGGAAAGVPVVLDGVIAAAAAVVAAGLVPDCVGYLLAGHRSAEPGATVALEHLSLAPLLDLGLRLGEGTGACLALPLACAAAAVLGEMATFGEAGVTDEHA
ncbi:MAG: nicotinate-nucleotide--dimethylbenzimidazole phosphoribosyltransferase [Actinomycetota bacterium]|nr:nicotinate-nucleotide--dimethylbenzimidazole phosphoribosyltransferase [Actinomycetota bacterium]